MKIKNYLMALFIIMIIMPLNAQLRNPYHTDTHRLSILQFPAGNPEIKARTLEITVGSESALDDVTDSNSRLGGLASAVVEDERSQTTTQIRTLIPDVFPAQDALFLEVTVSNEERGQNLELEEVLFEPEAHSANQSIGIKVEYRLYHKPEGGDKELLESNGPYWIVGRGEGDMFASSQRIQNSRMALARRWAAENVQNKYGIRYTTINVPVYRVRGLESNLDNQASEKQEELGELIRSFNSQHRTEVYQNKAKENLAFWEKILNEHQPGEDAPVNDENVWTVYNNLAVANFLLGNREQANQHIEEAIGINYIDWEKTTNNQGEVIGLSRVGIYDEESIANLHIFKRMMESYFPGIDAMNPQFIAFLANSNAREKASTTAREWGMNIFLSQLISDIDGVVEFVCSEIGSEQPKEITGSITKNGDKLADYTIKKSFLFALTNAYRIKIETADGAIQTNQKNGSIMLPNGIYNSRFNLISQINISNIKTDSKGRWRSDNGINVMYDYDGNILLESTMLRETGIFNSYVGVNEKDALGVKNMTYLLALNDDFSVKSVDYSSSQIDRDRNIGFFGAFIDKKLDPSTVMETNELYSENSSGSIQLSDNEKIINNNNEAVRKEISRELDNNGNWRVKTIGDIEITRTIEL
ncbi:hypothetical protein QA597_04485 [Marinilabiliaceae bacterium ANBcel2]|nr:hypothetical protein [Marinilabiliaceae bacterium ANBcel2]